MQRQRFFLALVIALAMLTALAGPSRAGEKPFVIAMRGDATTMDPHGRTEDTNQMILGHIFSKLVTVDPKNTIVPELARSWKKVDDLTWEFSLHKGLKFTNGEPINAAAVKYSIERALNHPKSQFAHTVPDYKELVAVDESTFRLVLKKPNPEVLQLLPTLVIIPPKYYQSQPDTHLAANPVGGGPYKFVKWVKGEYLELERNDAWPLVKPDFSRVRFRPIPEDATRVAALISGEVDVAAALPIADLPRIKGSKNTFLLRCPSERVIHLMFDVHTKEGGPAPEKQPGIPAGKPNPFRDVRVRQAVAHAINVQELIDQVMEGSAYPATQMISAHVDGFNPAIRIPKFDRAAAKKLLAEAGFPNGFEANLDAPNDRYINDRLMAEAIAGQLEEVGIKLNVIAQPKAMFFAKIDRFESPLYLGGWSSPSFEATYDKYVRVQTKKYGRNNRGRLNDPELERMLDEASTTLDDGLRTKRRQAAALRIHNHFFLLPLYQEEIVTGVNARVKSETCRVNEHIYSWDFKQK